MKNSTKKKFELKATGNKSIKLKDWKKRFLEILNNKKTPVFYKVPGSVDNGINNHYNGCI